jgi:biopolymer transport protein ExbD
MVISTRTRCADELPVAEGFAALAVVLFALMILFVVHGRFAIRAGVDLTSSEAVPTGENRPDPLVVRVTSAGTIHLRGGHVEVALLRRAIDEARFASPRSPLMVVGEQGARASLIARVLDQCRLTGAPDIRFALLEE